VTLAPLPPSHHPSRARQPGRWPAEQGAPPRASPRRTGGGLPVRCRGFVAKIPQVYKYISPEGQRALELERKLVQGRVISNK